MVVFWRCSNESVSRHRNPLFDIALGITVDGTMTVDFLHCLHLGVFQHYCKIVVWMLLESAIWSSTATNQDERHEVAVLCLRSELGLWYDARKRTHPGEDLTVLHDLTVKMLGTKDAPALKMSGAETWGFLMFLVDGLEKHGAALGVEARRLREAGLLLIRFMTILATGGATLEPHELQDLACVLFVPHYCLHVHT